MFYSQSKLLVNIINCSQITILNNLQFASLNACTVGQRATYSVGTCQAGTSAVLAVSPETQCNTYQYKTAGSFVVKIVYIYISIT